MRRFFFPPQSSLALPVTHGASAAAIFDPRFFLENRSVDGAVSQTRVQIGAHIEPGTAVDDVPGQRRAAPGDAAAMVAEGIDFVRVRLIDDRPDLFDFSFIAVTYDR